MKIMKSKSLLAFSLVAILSTGMFSFASANSHVEQKGKVVVTESKEFKKLNTSSLSAKSSWAIAWTKGADSGFIAWTD